MRQSPCFMREEDFNRLNDHVADVRAEFEHWSREHGYIIHHNHGRYARLYARREISPPGISAFIDAEVQRDTFASSEDSFSKIQFSIHLGVYVLGTPFGRRFLLIDHLTLYHFRRDLISLLEQSDRLISSIDYRLLSQNKWEFEMSILRVDALGPDWSSSHNLQG